MTGPVPATPHFQIFFRITNPFAPIIETKNFQRIFLLEKARTRRVRNVNAAASVRGDSKRRRSIWGVPQIASFALVPPSFITSIRCGGTARDFFHLPSLTRRLLDFSHLARVCLFHSVTMNLCNSSK